MQQQYVIVGANLAGGTAAITLREEGFDGEIVLIGAEPQPPYERPTLSKEYLQGTKPFEDALLKPANYYTEHNIQTLFGVRATRVDPQKQVVELEDANRIIDESRSDRRVVLVGMGFIGCEVAASLRSRGVEVTVVEFFKTPLFRVLGEQIGRVFEAIHREQGVHMFFEESVAAFEGTRRVRHRCGSVVPDQRGGHLCCRRCGQSFSSRLWTIDTC